MSGIKRRLERLEASSPNAGRWQIPIEVRLLLKEIERHQAARAGLPLPEYTAEEWAEHLRQEEEFAGSELERELDEYLEDELEEE